MGILHVLLVVLDLEIDLGIDPGIQVVIGNDLLRLGIDHHFGDIDPVHLFDDGNDPVKTRLAKPRSISQDARSGPDGSAE